MLQRVSIERRHQPLKPRVRRMDAAAFAAAFFRQGGCFSRLFRPISALHSAAHKSKLKKI
jgi:hypothetical protein